MAAVTTRYGASNLAFIVVPLVCAFFILLLVAGAQIDVLAKSVMLRYREALGETRLAEGDRAHLLADLTEVFGDALFEGHEVKPEDLQDSIQ